MEIDRVSFDAAVERFLPRVHKTDGCWLWTGATFQNGYGKIRFNGHMVLAHRFAFLIAYGHWPTPCCLHSCDTPLCMRPIHLIEGTQKQNIADRHRKGRSVSGERSGRAKLTDAQVVEIGHSHEKSRILAFRYGVTRTQIEHIWRGKSRMKGL